MNFALFLHIYQPPTQEKKMLDRIVSESYEKIVEILEEDGEARITLNICASLTEQLKSYGYSGLLKRIRNLAEKGQIEFTGSAAYHPILTDLPKREIIRQINLNNSINQTCFGSAYNPIGFFPPEMAYEKGLGKIIEELGYKWMLVDESGLGFSVRGLRELSKRKEGKLLFFSREDEISYKIAFGKIRSVLGLVRKIGVKEIAKKKYMVLAMDGETFGHHQKKQLKLLKDLLYANKHDRRIELVRMSDLMKIYKQTREVELLRSTWGYTEEINGEKVWVRWKNPYNPVHLLLDELRDLAIRIVRSDDKESRELLDKALNSDTFWWASGKPYWHPGFIRIGIKLYLQSILKSQGARGKDVKRARYLAEKKLNRLMREKMRTKALRKKTFSTFEMNNKMN